MLIVNVKLTLSWLTLLTVNGSTWTSWSHKTDGHVGIHK